MTDIDSKRISNRNGVRLAAVEAVPRDRTPSRLRLMWAKAAG